MRNRQSRSFLSKLSRTVQRTSLLDVKLARTTFETEAVDDFLEITLKYHANL
jgi:hypothetical protein